MEDKRKLIYSIFFGIAGGVLLALLLLFVIHLADVRLWNASLLILCVMAAALPMCLSFLHQLNFYEGLLRYVMLGISYLICTAYSFVISKTLSTTLELCTIMAIVHGVMVLVSVFCLMNNKD